jgi:chromosome segregation ATPase
MSPLQFDQSGQPVPRPGQTRAYTSNVVKCAPPIANTSAPSTEKPDKSKSALLEYSKAVIKSGMDCDNEKAQSLEANIINTRDKVIATHESTVNELKTSTSNWDEEKCQLKETIATLEKDKTELKGEMFHMRRVVAGLRERSVREKKEIQRYKGLWEEGLTRIKELEKENEQFETDRSKRRRVEEIWERAEKVKMDE